MKKKPLLIIEWDDTFTKSSWIDERDTENLKSHICHTVGWKMKSAKGKITVASSRNWQNECADTTIIPKANVKSIRRLE